MIRSLLFLRAIPLFCFLVLIPFEFHANADDTESVVVDGEVSTPLRLTPANLAAMPRHTVDVTNRRGILRKYEGVLLFDILQAAHPTGAPSLPGAQNRFTILVMAEDGVGSSFSFGEVDPALAREPVLLADKMDGEALTPDAGPTRIVVPSDLKPERWLKKVASITVRLF